MEPEQLRLGDGSGQTWDSATRELLDRVEPDDVFGAQWSRQQQAHLFALERSVSEWAETTVLLTATASTEWPNSDRLIPPVTHLRRGLLASADARQKALSRALSGTTWRAIRTYGANSKDTNTKQANSKPNSEGFLHQHTAVYVGAEVDTATFEPWVSAHTSNSPLASPSAHKEGTIRPEPERDGDQGLVAYIMANCPGLDTRKDRGHGLHSATTEQQQAAVVIDRSDLSPLQFGHTSFSSY